MLLRTIELLHSLRTRHGVAIERFSSSGHAHSSNSLASGTGKVVDDSGWLRILHEILDRQIAEP